MVVIGRALFFAGVILLFIAVRRQDRRLLWPSLALIVVPVLAYVAMLAWLFTAIAGQDHVSPDEWPGAVTRMQTQIGVDADRIDVASLGGFIDTRYAWRIPVDEPRLDEALAVLGAEPIERSAVPDEFWRVFPRRFRPEDTSRARFFMTQSFPLDGRGQDGNHQLAMYDPAEGMLYVWEVDNF